MKKINLVFFVLLAAISIQTAYAEEGAVIRNGKLHIYDLVDEEIPKDIYQKYLGIIYYATDDETVIRKNALEKEVIDDVPENLSDDDALMLVRGKKETAIYAYGRPVYFHKLLWLPTKETNTKQRAASYVNGKWKVTESRPLVEFKTMAVPVVAIIFIFSLFVATGTATILNGIKKTSIFIFFFAAFFLAGINSFFLTVASGYLGGKAVALIIVAEFIVMSFLLYNKYEQKSLLKSLIFFSLFFCIMISNALFKYSFALNELIILYGVTMVLSFVWSNFMAITIQEARKALIFLNNSPSEEKDYPAK